MMNFPRTNPAYISLLLTTIMFAACAQTPPITQFQPTTQGPIVSEEPIYELGEEQVAFTAAEMTIHGTLTAPRSEARHPAVVLIAGSGPTDRDWNNPLLPGDNGSAQLLAEALSRRGVVVLRYDKRGTGKTGVPAEVTWPDYLAEIGSALALLTDHARVDSRALIVAGHSEGGAHALKFADEGGAELVGVVLLSTAGRSLRDVILWQIDENLRQGKVAPEDRAREQKTLGNALDTIIAGEEADPQSASVYPGVQNLVTALQSPDAVKFGRELLAFDPQAAAARLRVPVLILSGAKDLQIHPQHDARPLYEAARGGDATLHIAPDADHVLKYEETPAEELSAALALKYNAPDRDLDPTVVPALIGWILEKSLP